MKRWLLWAFVCRRGRRCAHLVVDDFKTQGGVPPGSIFRLGYECAACGTVYEGSFLVGNDDGLVEGDRVRVTGARLRRALEHRSGVAVPGGGGSVTFVATDDEEGLA